MGEWQRPKGCSTNECIEVRDHGSAIEIRNSELPFSSIFASHEKWAVFVAGIKAGDFDDVAPALR